MGGQMGEAEKLDEAAGGLPVTEEVAVSTETTETTEKPENPENPDDVEDDEEDDKEADEEIEYPEWQEERAIQVFCRPRLMSETF